MRIAIAGAGSVGLITLPEPAGATHTGETA